ncbi:MAG: hypothetical protein U1E54_04050, partial [Candidatus Levybacteria bacterium]|nr:hypothetical protein [Candidatus Levybacteria bacterium]
DKTITKELVEQKYQIASMQYQIAQMIRSLENKETKSALESVAKLANEGIEMGYFMQALIETLHNNLLLKVGVDLKETSGFKIENSKMEIGEIKRLIELLSKAHGELKYAVLPQIPLELAIVEWSLQGAQTNAEPSVVAEPRKNIAQHNSASDSASSSAFFSEKAIVVKKDVVVNKTPIVTTQQGIGNYSENDALWNALIDKIKAYNHSVAGVLRGCRIKSYNGKILEIETNFKFHKDKLSERKTQEILDQAIKDVTKKNVKIEVLLKGGDKK